MQNDMKLFNIDESVYETKLTKKYTNRKKFVAKNIKLITAFIPGVIRDIYVKVGQSVSQGDKLLILEAMKMKNTILAPLNSKIKAIHIEKDQSVPKSALLIELE